MEFFGSITREKSRGIFLASFALSALLPLLIMIFITHFYVIPMLNSDQMDRFRQVFTMGILAMGVFPLLSFFLMSRFINDLERLAREVKSRSTQWPELEFADKNEVTALQNAFNQVYAELQAKMDLLYQHSDKLIASSMKLSRQAITDELTGLYNRRHFDVRLLDETARADRYGHDLALIMVDVDLFKKYNDIHGHQTGDRLLKAVAFVIQKQVRKSDIPCRFGGDEFCVILPECTVEDARKIARKMAASIESQQFKSIKGLPISNVSISCGVAEYQGDMERFLEQADEMLYTVKKSKRTPAVARGA